MPDAAQRKRGKDDKKLRHNVALSHERTARLACKHETKAQPVASLGSRHWFWCDQCGKVVRGRFVA